MIFYCLHHHSHNIFVEYFTPFRQLTLKLKGSPIWNSLRVKEIFNDGIFVEKKLTGGVKFLCPRSEHSSARVSIRGKKSFKTDRETKRRRRWILNKCFIFVQRSIVVRNFFWQMVNPTCFRTWRRELHPTHQKSPQSYEWSSDQIKWETGKLRYQSFDMV